jgi:hypothetical protein
MSSRSITAARLMGNPLGGTIEATLLAFLYNDRDTRLTNEDVP